MAKSIFSTSAAPAGTSPFEDLGAALHSNLKTVLIRMKGGDVRDGTGLPTARLGTIRDSGQARPGEIEKIANFLGTEEVVELLARVRTEAARVAETNRDVAATFGLGLSAPA